KLIAAAVLCATAAGLYAGLRPAPVARAVVAQAEDPWKKYLYQDSSACMTCHTRPTQADVGKGALNLVILTEYAIWRTHDKHAQAYAVLEGPRGKQMAKVLGMDVTKERAGCLNCHAMNNLSKENMAKQGGQGLNPQDGVSCGGCHGPSSGWT